ncbi:uncharacterized protein LOC122039719 [Zingiber officinale]|uniref:Uncharacterized protein n=1 Tax=Zingiber officinale TaxID=94328 RepID=A0A8J5LZ56_ZINOF|nr:uncharacterized protein LOC122039719 [Zingiber officinale]KAG6527974.1 hypothetical protein ZIOFF_010110 [Zingiber officinale]
MGILSVASPPAASSSAARCRAHKSFLFSNYVLLGAASSCIFLTFSLRLLPSACGFLLILLHAFTIAAAIAGCGAAAAAAPSSRWYGAHMVATVLAAILQGAVAVLALTRTADFLADGLKSYVREEDGAVILRMVGALGVLIFCMEWVVMALAFVLRYYAYIHDGAGTAAAAAKVQPEGQYAGDWQPFHV